MFVQDLPHSGPSDLWYPPVMPITPHPYPGMEPPKPFGLRLWDEWLHTVTRQQAILQHVALAVPQPQTVWLLEAWLFLRAESSTAGPG